MSELLFENTLIKESLENLLALNQINKYELEIDKYAKEIRSLQAEMAEILKKENIDEEVVNRIYTYRTILSSLDDENDRLQEIDETLEINQKRIKELQDRIDETEAKLEELKTEIFETTDPERIIECQNEIENNNVRLNDLTEILDAVTGENTPLLVEKEYLSAKNDEGDFNIPSNNKQELSKDLSKTEEEFNKALEKLPLPIREEIEFCQKKIQNREIEIQKFTTKKESVINAFPEACSTNVKEAHDAINLLKN